MRTLALMLVLALFAGTAFGDGIVNPGTQFMGNMHEGISNPGGTPAPPGACAGAVDFSDGCAIAVFGR